MSQELVDGAVQAMQSAPIQATPRGALSVIGRGIAYIIDLGGDKVKSLGLEGVIKILEQAYQTSVIDANFESVPDYIEDPLEAWGKKLIRPIVTQLFGAITGA